MGSILKNGGTKHIFSLSCFDFCVAISRNYKVRASGMKQWYLLSVFIGDYIRDVQFCKQLSKRLACDRNQKEFVRD